MNNLNHFYAIFDCLFLLRNQNFPINRSANKPLSTYFVTFTIRFCNIGTCKVIVVKKQSFFNIKMYIICKIRNSSYLKKCPIKTNYKY